jgi:hypothetical protein
MPASTPAEDVLLAATSADSIVPCCRIDVGGRGRLPAGRIDPAIVHAQDDDGDQLAGVIKDTAEKGAW